MVRNLLPALAGLLLLASGAGAQTKVIGPGGWNDDGTTVKANPGRSVAIGATVLNAKGNTITLSATGAADQVQVNAAITTLNAAGGGTVILAPGTWVLSAPIVPQSHVTLRGSTPGIGTFDVNGNNYWVLDGTGTVLSGTGAFPCIAANNVPQAASAGYAAANSLLGVGIYDLGLSGCSRGIDIGSQNNPGLYYSQVRNIFASGNTGWGLNFENFSETTFDHLFSVSNAVGDMHFAGSVAKTAYYPGNSVFTQLYSSPLNAYARGIVFESLGANGALAGLNMIDVRNLQVNRYRDDLISQTVTPANGSTSVSVTNLSAFRVGLPVYFTASNNGYYSGHVYFVLSVSGASGAGTITLGEAMHTATAISAGGSTAMQLRSYGHAGVEINGDPATSSNVSSLMIKGLDIEGACTVGLYIAESYFTRIETFASDVTGGPVMYKWSNVNTLDIVDWYSHKSDTDWASTVTWTGARGSYTNGTTKGFYYDANTGAWSFNLYGGFNPDLMERYPGSGSFTYPAQGLGEMVTTQDTSATLDGNKCGVVVFNGASGQTITLPVIDSGSSAVNTYLGCRVKIVNASQTNTVTVSTSSSQLFNNKSAKTSIVLPANAVLEVTASKTAAGSVVFWAAIYGATLP